MSEIVLTMKLHILPDEDEKKLLSDLTVRYAEACSFISEYIFGNDFLLNSIVLQTHLYQTIRELFDLKSQMAISSIKTVVTQYKTVKTQFSQDPYRYKDESNKWRYIPRTLEWLQKPIHFKRPQADLVRGRDYSFVTDPKTKKSMLSLNTLESRIRVAFDVPEHFEHYFNGTWSFGTGKLVSLKGEWYFHIPMTKEIDTELPPDQVKHVVGMDRGLRFLATTYDEEGKVVFISGSEIMAKRDTFQKVRDKLQSKGTKSAKQALKRISGRENRWMSDVNHQISKTLVEQYGKGTLFVLENLTGVSFSEENLSNTDTKGRKDKRSWAFYQLEQFLTYKARAIGSDVIKVYPFYTSQRCPNCGRINKKNRHHETHEYICDCCGYRSNDDRVAAMNIQTLGTLYVSGDTNPRFVLEK